MASECDFSAQVAGVDALGCHVEVAGGDVDDDVDDVSARVEDRFVCFFGGGRELWRVGLPVLDAVRSGDPFPVNESEFVVSPAGSAARSAGSGSSPAVDAAGRC